MRHAFADESHRKGQYLMCATAVSISDLPKTRRMLRDLRLRGQRRIHFANESDSRRKSILATLTHLDMTNAIYIAPGREQAAARRTILQKMVTDLRAQGVTRLVLDSRQGQDHKDRSTIHVLLQNDTESAFEYGHERSAHEPVLWVPDAVAWAWGRGGEWRRRAERLRLSVSKVELL